MKKEFKLFVFFALFVSFFLGSCSRIDVATNFADTYIAAQLDKYFDINSIQSEFVKKSLKHDIVSIRRIIFPKAADELEKVLKENDEIRTWNKDIFMAHEKSMKEIFYSSIKILEHSAVEFTSQLKPEQLKAFQKEFRKKTEDIQELVDDPKKSREKRFDKTRKFIEGWIGSLTNGQKKDLQNFCQLHLFPYREQIQNREKLSKGFADAFPDLEKRKQYVSELFLNYENLRDPQYTSVVLEDQDKLMDFIVKLANSMNDDQRNHLRSTLKDRIKQLRESATGSGKHWF